MKRWLLSIIVSAVMIVMAPLYVFAEEKTEIELAPEDLNISKECENQVNEIGEEIFALLNTSSIDEYESVIAEASEKYEQKINNIYIEVITDSLSEYESLSLAQLAEKTNTNVPTVVLEENVIQSLTYTFPISDVAVFEITPLYISLETVGSDYNADEKVATKKSTNGYSTKAYYSGGTKIATSKVSCNFYYNGTKAWYKSGLKGSLTVNAPSNWNKMSGKAYRSQYSSTEKSYWAYYTGKVAQNGELWGGGVPVKLKTVLVQAGVVCSKTGYITTKNTADEVSNN